ncbi:MAG: cytochrome-c peroxidase [Chthoniobacterales bacterium]
MPPEKWPPAEADASVKVREIAPLPEPMKFDKAKAALGIKLFFDPRLSGSQQMSCASCHAPELAWSDGLGLPRGNHRKQLKRNTPPLLNVAHQKHFFWDGRVDSLSSLVLAVIGNRDEMHGSYGDIIQRIQKQEVYQKDFKNIYGAEDISAQKIGEVVAEFLKTIQSRGKSRFDRFVAGDQKQLSDQEVLGLHLFRTKAGCMNCHSGPYFTDDSFHDLGLSYFGRSLEDLGRYHITKNPEDSGKFKTPGLRNVTRTAPYMHVGLFPLRGVMNLYNAGMPTLKRKPGQENDPLFPTKSPLLKPLNLSPDEITAIMAFLGTLEERPQRMRKQPFPPIVAEEKQQ